MATTSSGYQGQLFYGTAGGTAAQQVTNCVDLNYDTEPERAETTVRGAGTAVPVVTSKTVALKPVITWSMLQKSGDTVLTALLAAARTGAAVALRTKSFASGTGFDGDCTLGVTHEMTLKGESKYNFTAEATDDEGRAPQLNV